jgi:hypothetical protein
MTDVQRLLAKLDSLYHDQTKHAVYQDVPDFVREALGYAVATNEQWRGVGSRWEYMRTHLDFTHERVLDVGANTGFFTLSLAKAHPTAVCTALEGNSNHAEFIQEVAAHFNLHNVRILRQYLDFASLEQLGLYDTVLLNNVLHHAGVDFDRGLVQTRQKLFDYLVDYLGKLKNHCRRLVFQMGYNWGGNKQQPVVALADDPGKCLYVSRALRQAGWNLAALALPYRIDGRMPVEHRDAPKDVVDAANAGDEVLLRKRIEQTLDPAVPEFSEFYRRPIFVCTH